MAYLFPSDEWIGQFKEMINASGEYRESAATWEAGDICYVVHPSTELGLAEPCYIRLDLYHGECLEARRVDAEQGLAAKFQIFADYGRWKKLLQGKLDPVTALMMGKISAKGDLPTIMKYSQAAKELLVCAGRIETRFLDES